jgi:uncharacterized protein YjlB
MATRIAEAVMLCVVGRDGRDVSVLDGCVLLLRGRVGKCERQSARLFMGVWGACGVRSALRVTTV